MFAGWRPSGEGRLDNLAGGSVFLESGWPPDWVRFGKASIDPNALALPAHQLLGIIRWLQTRSLARLLTAVEHLDRLNERTMMLDLVPHQ